MSAQSGTTDYRLAPALAVRLVGVALCLVAVVVFVGTLVLAWVDVHVSALIALVGLALLAVLAGGWWLSRRAYVVRLTDEGYRVRFVRGAGATRARWRDVEQAVTTTVAGAPCVVLRLRDGRSTTIPIEVLGGSGGRFAEDVRARLRRGKGPRLGT